MAQASMITARNYAAQAERGLLMLAEQMGRHADMTVDAWMVKTTSKAMGTAQHFALPDDGVLFDDALRGMRNFELRLPYPEITVEYFVNESPQRDDRLPNHSAKRVVLAMEVDRARIEAMMMRAAPTMKKEASSLAHLGDSFILVYAANEIRGQWLPVICGWAVPRDWDRIEMTQPIAAIDPCKKKVTLAGLPVPLCPRTANRVVEEYGQEEGLRCMTHDISGEVRAVLELCEALSCSNVKTESMGAIDQTKAARRARDGKLPLYETKRLVIEAGRADHAPEAREAGGDRSGPRQHLRRGHVRVLCDQRRVWVNSCVVGSAAEGRIEKSYAVTNLRAG